MVGKEPCISMGNLFLKLVKSKYHQGRRSRQVSP
nr:MAG TPA: hypothetical protein [Caudoviricetes sp.]